MNQAELIRHELDRAGIAYTFFGNEFLFTVSAPMEASIRFFSDGIAEYRVYYPYVVSKRLQEERDNLAGIGMLLNEINRYCYPEGGEDDSYRYFSRAVLFVEEDAVDLGFIGCSPAVENLTAHMQNLASYLKALYPCIDSLLNGTFDAGDALEYCRRNGLLPD